MFNKTRRSINTNLRGFKAAVGRGHRNFHVLHAPMIRKAGWLPIVDDDDGLGKGQAAPLGSPNEFAVEDAVTDSHLRTLRIGESWGVLGTNQVFNPNPNPQAEVPSHHALTQPVNPAQ